MADPLLIKRWKVTETLLQRARRHAIAANPDVAAVLGQFDELLKNNELGLALDELSAIGLTSSCRGSFWRTMERAALVMKETEKANEFRQRFEAMLAEDS